VVSVRKIPFLNPVSKECSKVGSLERFTVTKVDEVPGLIETCLQNSLIDVGSTSSVHVGVRVGVWVVIEVGMRPETK